MKPNPLTTDIRARVAINGAILCTDTRYPDILPTRSPHARDTIIARGSGIDRVNKAHNTPTMATIDPTERSMPPVSITSSIPILMIPTGVTCRIRLNKLAGVKNTSDTIAETASIIRKMKTVLYFTIKCKVLLKLVLKVISTV